MNVAAPPRMTVPEYFAWAERQPRGRFELAAGRVVAISPETNRHVLVKLGVAAVLREIVASLRLPCTVFADGVTVVIDERTAREPDAVVQCGGEVDLDSLTIDQPLIVVEVLSPSSARSDTGQKFAEYFSLPTVRHYLIVDPVKRLAIHHRRDDSGDILSRIVAEGPIEFAPPGFAVAVERFFEGLPADVAKDGGSPS